MKSKNILCDFVEKDAPFSHIVESKNIVYLSGIIAADDIVSGKTACLSIGTETSVCLSLIKKMLASVSLNMSNITTVLVHMTNLSEFEEMNYVYKSFFEKGSEPARTCVEVSALLKGSRIEFTCQAQRP